MEKEQNVCLVLYPAPAHGEEGNLTWFRALLVKLWPKGPLPQLLVVPIRSTSGFTLSILIGISRRKNPELHLKHAHWNVKGDLQERMLL